MQQVIVTVYPARSVKIDAKGFKGNGCAKATEQIEVVLGGATPRSKKKKPEFFAPAATGVANKVKGF